MEFDSPYLVALGGSDLPFVVDVVFCHFFKKLFQTPFRLAFGYHNKRSLFDHQLDRRILLQTYLIRERFWDAKGQAVAPFLYVTSQSYSSRYVSTMKIHLLAPFVKACHAHYVAF